MKIKNYKRFQHFKERKPQWIKLYRDIIDDVDISSLSDKSFRVLIGLWLLASEDPKKEGTLPDERTMAFRLRIQVSEINKAIQELRNFLDDVDISPISTRYQHDILEREESREQSKEESREEGLELSKPNSNPVGIFKKNIQPHNNGLTDEQKKNRDEINKLVEVVLSCFKRLSFRTSPRIITDTHIKLIKARIEQDKRHQSPDYWEWFFGQVEESDFLSGRIAPIGDRRLFKPSLEWLFNKNNFAKVVNGNYANTTRRIS